MDWIKIFASGMVAALITAFITWLIAAKRIFIENITQERAKWREKVRAGALLVHDAMIERKKEDLDRHRNEFRALLNPFDCEDMDILQCIKLPQQGDELVLAEEFSDRIARLLKHDWDRAKLEAKYFSFLRQKLERKPYRVCGSNANTKTGVITK